MHKAHSYNNCEWPSKSPDLNPIEYIWNELGQRVYWSQNAPLTQQEFQNILVQNWANIPVAYFRNYIMPMPSFNQSKRGTYAVLTERGGLWFCGTSDLNCLILF